eukprot:3329720-Rhodomonas_salina.3
MAEVMPSRTASVVRGPLGPERCTTIAFIALSHVERRCHVRPSATHLEATSVTCWNEWFRIPFGPARPHDVSTAAIHGSVATINGAQTGAFMSQEKRGGEKKRKKKGEGLTVVAVAVAVEGEESVDAPPVRLHLRRLVAPKRLPERGRGRGRGRGRERET